MRIIAKGVTDSWGIWKQLEVVVAKRYTTTTSVNCIRRIFFNFMAVVPFFARPTTSKACFLSKKKESLYPSALLVALACAMSLKIRGLAGKNCLCNAVTLSLSHSSMGGATSVIQICPLLVLLVIVNIVSLVLFGVDKLKSKSGGWRIPESKLLLLALVGPFGAYAGMLLFRHKTRKVKFLLVPIFMFIQIGLIVYLRFI